MVVAAPSGDCSASVASLAPWVVTVVMVVRVAETMAVLPAAGLGAVAIQAALVATELTAAAVAGREMVK